MRLVVPSYSHRNAAQAVLLSVVDPHDSSLSISESLEKLIIFGVRANPEPNHGVVAANTQGAIISADSNGENRFSRMNFLEPETWVIRIGLESPVG